MANGIYNYGQGYPLRNDFNYTGDQDWYNYGNAPPTGIQYPGGNPAYPRNEGLYQDRIMGMTNMPASKYITKKQDTEPGFLRKTWDKTKDLASQAKGAPLGLLNLLTRR